jgi:hypothetical protein
VPEATTFLDGKDVAFVFFGPREQDIGGFVPFTGLELVFQVGEVGIYAVDPTIRAGRP